jgi:hypothetical protein
MFQRYLLAGVLGLSASSLGASTDVNFGISASDQGGSSFYLNVGQYYGVPEQQVVAVRERRIPDDEIPVVFFIAREARVEPRVIIEQRLGGRSWMDISLAYHLSPAVFYVPYQGDPGPPYGHAYGLYRRHRRADWGRIRLADDDVVNMVNMRFMKEHYGYRPEEVVAMRSQGRAFHEFKRGNGNGRGPGMRPEGSPGVGPGDGPEGRPGKGKGHGKGGHGKKDRDEGEGRGRGED